MESTKLSEDHLKTPRIKSVLVEELEYFQSQLHGDYLVESAREPTAADFSVYVQLERLVGTMGDAHVYCSLPELLEIHELEPLWTWHRKTNSKGIAGKTAIVRFG